MSVVSHAMYRIDDRGGVAMFVAAPLRDPDRAYASR